VATVGGESDDASDAVEANEAEGASAIQNITVQDSVLMGDVNQVRQSDDSLDEVVGAPLNAPPIAIVVGETLSIQTEPVARAQMISWQVWQPVLLGLVAAFLSKFLWLDYVYPAIGFDSQWWLDNGSLLFSGDILAFLFALSSLHWYDNWGQRAKMLISASISINFCLMLLLFSGLFCWPIIILVWVLITVVWGKYRLSPYRTGIWLGVGGAVALILGGIMAHFVL
jgi:hypothetical protein